jgi:SNF2 family DNA or RNA helicase
MHFTPHPYQQDCIGYLLTEEQAAVLLDPGYGKTSIMLSVIAAKKMQTMIVAPVRVLYGVWRQEAAKWEQFRHLTFAIVHGTPKERMKALQSGADILLVSTDGIKWIEEQGFKPERLVIDESSKFKNWTSKRTKAMRKVCIHAKSRYILTGTPCPQSLMDLFPQIFIVDHGQRLGKTITSYKSKYFLQGGFKGYEWILRKGAKEQIQEAIADCCYRLDARDHLQLPDIHFNTVWLDLPDLKQYKELEEDMYLDLEGGGIAATSSGSALAMCRQYCQGQVYEGDGFVKIHDEKMEALEELLDELQGKPALIAYQFRSDYARFKERWPKMPAINGDTKPAETLKLVEAWNRGELSKLAVQPQALSYGMNMQAGGNDLVWYGLTANLETYLQLNARLHRQGQKGQVRVHHLLCRKTVEEAMLESIEKKASLQEILLNFLAERRKNERASY